jgi:nucleoside-diphosphate-sugar epimerase
MSISPASAHGVSVGTSTGGLGQLLLIVITSVVLFSLFLVFNHPKKGWTVLVTGGGGYVGSALVPKLLGRGHMVTVLDLYPYGDDVLDSVQDHANLKQIEGDFRDRQTLEGALGGCDAVVHLACIANGHDPGIANSVDGDAFRLFVQTVKEAGVKRFIYASSFRVYGVKDEPEVTEELPLEPLTDDAKHKALCEKVLEEERATGFVTCTVRPAIVCGYAPSQRLDLIVNALTHDAFDKGRIRVVGGSQRRPTIHIDDMTDLYLLLLDQPAARIDGKTFNAGAENLTLLELADIVKAVVDDEVSIDVEPTDDLDSYRISSDRLRHELGFESRHTVVDAVSDLVAAFRSGKIPASADDPEASDTSATSRS